jgi:hypothetical protein
LTAKQIAIVQSLEILRTFVPTMKLSTITIALFVSYQEVNSFTIQSRHAFSSARRMTTSTETRELGTPGTAKLDVAWEELGFEFRPTKSHVRVICRDGEWGKMELVTVRNAKECLILYQLLTNKATSGSRD